ncbi:MAG: FtsH protease activity modulator HflK [Deltaproteobacteria bacterium]|nr:FtsH protease activity modulator HflK [Deltaproteobacteria bacterium]
MNWDWEKLQQQHKRRTGSGNGSDGPPPGVEEVLNKLKATRFNGGWLLIVAVFLVVLMGSTMVFMVGSNELGVIQRFGRYVRTVSPGLHFKLPALVEKLTKVKTDFVYTEKFGSSSDPASVSGRFSAGTERIDATMMLTGDLNVGVVPWIVQYRIKDPYNYLFKVRDVPQLIRDMSEASMRLVVGDRSINEVISKRQEIAIEAKRRLQKDMKEAESGVEIVAVELQNTNVPGPVQNSFNEVNKAVQEREKVIYQAKEGYNKVIPEARGEADRTIETSKGYATARINRAKGETARFTDLYDEYTKARDVTRRRLYFEMLKDVIPKLKNRYIIDAGEKNLLPFLNLGDKRGVINAK